jgi:hypothetical protein
MSDLPPPTPPEVPPPAPEPLPPEVPPVTEPTPAAPVSSDSGPLPKNDNEKTLAVVMHLLPLAGALTTLPFANIVAPLIFWLIKKNESPFLDAHGKEVLNFQINAGVLVFIGIFLCVLPGVIIGVGALVMMIIAALKVNEGQFYRYPWIYRIIK